MRNPPRFIKIDVDGAELDVLTSMQRLLAMPRPVAVRQDKGNR